MENRRVTSSVRCVVVSVCLLMLVSGCAGTSYKQQAFWQGAILGATVATPVAGIATKDQDEDDNNAAMVVGMVAGGIIGGVIGLMNAQETVAKPAKVEPPPEPKVAEAPPVIEKPVPVKQLEPPKPVEVAPIADVPVVEEKQTPPPAIEIKERIVLRGINFDFDKATIKNEFIPVLDEAVRLLKEREDVDVVIAGHTCWIGTDAYNQGLSERRADSVYNFLANRGIKKERMSFVGYGEKQPVADNKTDKGRRMNRRVEFQILN